MQATIISSEKSPVPGYEALIRVRFFREGSFLFPPKVDWTVDVLQEQELWFTVVEDGNLLENEYSNALTAALKKAEIDSHMPPRHP